MLEAMVSAGIQQILKVLLYVFALLSTLGFIGMIALWCWGRGTADRQDRARGYDYQKTPNGEDYATDRIVTHWVWKEPIFVLYGKVSVVTLVISIIWLLIALLSLIL
jgi:hypothetical protein